MNIIAFFLSENVQLLEVKFSIFDQVCFRKTLLKDPKCRKHFWSGSSLFASLSTSFRHISVL